MIHGAPSVGLLQSVLDVERPAGERREVDDHVGALGHAEADALDLDRLWQQIAAGRDLPEEVVSAQVVQIGQEELVEPRRPGVQPAKAVAARADVQHRLDLAVHRELVPQDAVQVEEIEEEETGPPIEALVGEHHGDVVRREGGQAEARRLGAGVELVEEQVEAGEALVDVLGGEVHAVVVVPERAHGLVDVAVRPMGRIESGVLVRIVLVVERDRTRLEEVTRKPVALRGRVTVVQMRAHRVLAEPAVVGGQVVEVPNQDRRVVVRDIRRAGADAVIAPRHCRLTATGRDN